MPIDVSGTTAGEITISTLTRCATEFTVLKSGALLWKNRSVLYTYASIVLDVLGNNWGCLDDRIRYRGS